MGDKTNIQTELELISALEREEVVSQAALSRRLSISVGLVNALMKRVIRKGLVKTRSAPYRRWVYYLTPAGFTEKSRLVARYLEVSLDFFRRARKEYDQVFADLHAVRVDRVVLAGTGELVEIAFLAAREHGVEIVGILDAEASEERFGGFPVVRDLSGVDTSAAVVVTASRAPQAAYDDIRRNEPARVVRAPSLLRISTLAPDAGHQQEQIP